MMTKNAKRIKTSKSDEDANTKIPNNVRTKGSLFDVGKRVTAVTPSQHKKDNVQVTLTQLLSCTEEDELRNEDDENSKILQLEPTDSWYDFELDNLAGKKYKTFECEYDDLVGPIIIGVPEFLTWTKQVNLDPATSTLHASVTNSMARRMVYDSPLGDYNKFLHDPDFVQENHQFVNGMVYMWYTLALPILEEIKEDSPDQKEWTEYEIPQIMQSLSQYKHACIGTLNTYFIRKYVEGLSSYENSTFACLMAHCARFDMYTRFTPSSKRNQPGKWRLITKVYRERDEQGNDVRPLQFAFGTTSARTCLFAD